MASFAQARTLLQSNPELYPLIVPVSCAVGFAAFTVVRNLSTNAALTVNSRPFDHEHTKLLQAPVPTLGGYSANDTVDLKQRRYTPSDLTYTLDSCSA